MVSRSTILILGALLAVASASSYKYDHKPAYPHKEPEYKKQCYIEYKKCCYKYEKCGYKYKKVKKNKKVCVYKPKKVLKKVCKNVIDYDYGYDYDYNKKDEYDMKKSEYGYESTGYDYKPKSYGYKPKGYDYKPKYKKVCYTKWEVKKEKVCYYQIYYKVYKYAKYCAKRKCAELKYKGDHKKPEKKVSKKGVFVRKFKGKMEYGKEKKEEKEKKYEEPKKDYGKGHSKMDEKKH